MVTATQVRPALDTTQFPITGRYHYLDTASVGPAPLKVSEAVAGCYHGFGELGSLALGGSFAQVQQTRALAGDLLGANPDGIAFTQSTTAGLCQIAQGLRLPEDSVVVLPAGEFPSLTLPFSALPGVRIRWVGKAGAPATLADYREAITAAPNPALVVTSWVNRNYHSLDLAELAALVHAHGGLLAADLIRGLGVQPVDLDAWQVDFGVANSYKWLVSGPGNGLLYVAPSLLDRVISRDPGWLSVASTGGDDAADVAWQAGARRFEGGTPNITGLTGLGAALDLLLEAGIEAIWRHVGQLRALARESLEAIGLRLLEPPPGLGDSATFLVPLTEADAVASRLSDREVICTSTGRALCVSLHGFNSDADIAALTSALHDVGAASPSI